MFSGRHRLSPRAAPGRPLRRGLRNLRSRRPTAAQRPRAVAPNSRTTARLHQAVWFQETRPQGRLLPPERRQPAPRLPELAGRVLAHLQRLRDALAPDPATTGASPPGIDFAAPTGTTVRTVGDGVVEFAGVQNGYGNIVIIKHRNNQRHGLRPPEPHRRARPARAVSQGQTIGAVGATGWATGPHLHFEFRVNGEYAGSDRPSPSRASRPHRSSAAAAPGLRPPGRRDAHRSWRRPCSVVSRPAPTERCSAPAGLPRRCSPAAPHVRAGTSA